MPRSVHSSQKSMPYQLICCYLQNQYFHTYKKGNSFTKITRVFFEKIRYNELLSQKNLKKKSKNCWITRKEPKAKQSMRILNFKFLKLYKITYFLSDLQSHHVNVNVLLVVASLFDLLAQIFQFFTHLFVARLPYGLYPINPFGLRIRWQSLLQIILEFWFPISSCMEKNENWKVQINMDVNVKRHRAQNSPMKNTKPSCSRFSFRMIGSHFSSTITPCGSENWSLLLK